MTRQRAWRLVPTLLLGLAAACGGAGGPPGAPGAPGAPAPGPGARPGSQPGAGARVMPRVAVVPDSDATAVAVAVVTPGSGWELPGTEGLTLLTARTLLEGIRPRLEALGAHAAVRCRRSAFTFTLLAPTPTWEPAVATLLDGLFRPAPDSAALERARRSLTASLVLDRTNPAWQARLGIRQALHGDTLAPSTWAGPGCGVPETLALFGLPEVRAGAYRFAASNAVAALIGPVDTAAAVLRSRLPPGPLPPLSVPPRVVAGERYLERNTVTAWVAVAFPFGPDADREAMRLLGSILEDDVAPGVARPDVFDAAHELEWRPDGGALIVYVVTAPAAAGAYADRLVGRARSMARTGVPPSVYERVLRRHRGRRLRERARPEDRAAAVAGALALGRPPGDGWPELAALTPGAIREAARSLGEPARVVVGPRSARGPAP